ncbi:hypothetical protein MHB44_09985 [Lysinibacillus sp. FSL H8-0500]|uniref:Uncharacterized protein n=1 Tax=Lysinibacillus macroides TaxID=33935 RepID=A0A0N0CUS0_9BACI|nr:hypothetical protein [Lysinibacillus macroides]KOY80595.1 hypothetical protein ADM90_15425 [Lysinibacillus macroides]QPR69733.1 hypothetical protein I6G82_09175 [Lysinibacillus macroides]
MDNELIAKITALVMEKVAQMPKEQIQGLTQAELQEWQSFRLMTASGSSQQAPSIIGNYQPLSTQELQHWEDLHRQQAFTQSTTTSSSDFIAFKKFI